MKVSVVSMDGCGGCEVVKNALKAASIEFEVVDFFSNDQFVNKYQVRALPTTVIEHADGLSAVSIPGARPVDVQKIKAIVKGEEY